MLLNRVTLFRFFGFDIKADGSWLFLPVLITWTLSTNVFPAIYPGHGPEVYRLMALAGLAGIFVSIIVHEVAHAVIAEHYQMPIASITLFVFGGVAEMKGEPSHAKGEFLMAIAGPVMSAFAALSFNAAGDVSRMFGAPAPVPVVLHYLGFLNFVIAGFNLIPAFPLDGGRALRAVIWRLKDNLVLATRMTSKTGYIFAYVLMAYGCWEIAWNDSLVAGMWGGLLGLFTHSASSYAVRQTESRSLLGTETVARFVSAQAVAVSPDITISALVDDYVYKHYQKTFPVVDRGQLVGVIVLQSVLSLDRHKWPWLHVASVMEPLSESTAISPSASAAEALDRMQRLGREALVVTEDRKLLGVIALRDLAGYIAVTMTLDRERPVAAGKKAH